MSINRTQEEIALYAAEINRLEVRIDETDNEAEKRDLEDKLRRYEENLDSWITRENVLDEKESA